MSTTSKFTVAASKNIIRYMLFGVALFVLLPVPFTVYRGVQHALLYIISGGLASIFGWLSLYTMTYKISVDGSSIHVRKSFFKKFSLDVADIDQVDWLVSSSGFGKMENVTVRVGSRKFGVQTFMTNSEEMMAYLKANVDDSKIRTETRGFVS